MAKKTATIYRRGPRRDINLDEVARRDRIIRFWWAQPTGRKNSAQWTRIWDRRELATHEWRLAMGWDEDASLRLMEEAYWAEVS
jgi:hypothetical protein